MSSKKEKQLLRPTTVTYTKPNMDPDKEEDINFKALSLWNLHSAPKHYLGLMTSTEGISRPKFNQIYSVASHTLKREGPH